MLPLQPLFLALAAVVLVVGGPTGARAALTILPVMVVGFGIWQAERLRRAAHE